MSDLAQDSLLQTKLQPPRLSQDVVHRPRLLDQLQSPSCLVLVVAPAGYGKTTLVGTWLETVPMPSAWLALDEEDNDFATFVRYLIGALQTRFPHIDSKTPSLFQTATPASVTSISNNLINEMSTIDQDFILVLDDYHLIHNSAIHKLLSDILRHPPASLHLVLAARNDPALPLPGLRARGLVTEIRATDLRFTLDETARFFRDVLQIEITDQDIASLINRTEGWPVSLRLAAIHFQHSTASSLIEASQRGANRYLIDYLVTEVTSHLSGEVQDFLVRTSILDQLCAPLCDALLDSGDIRGEAQRHLDSLVKSSFFTTPVQGASGWYRYHHMFRQFLLQELQLDHRPAEIAALHLRASHWFDGQGLLDKAISHAFAAGDTQAAVAVLVGHRRDLTNGDDWHVLERLLRLFPREVVDNHPELKLAEASVLLFQAQHARVAAALDAVDPLLAKWHLTEPEMDRLQGEIAARRAAIAYWGGNLAQSASLADFALEKLPLEWWQPRLQAKLFLAGALQVQGRVEEAIRLIESPSEPDFGSAYHARQLVSACFVKWVAADLEGVERAALQDLELYGKTKGSTEGVNWAYHFLGAVHYHRDNLEEAESYLQRLALHPQQIHTPCFINSTAALALISQLRGRDERAVELAEALLTLSLNADSLLGMGTAAALKAELALRQGHMAEASEWAERYQLPEVLRLPFFYAPPITYVKVLLARDTATSRRQAAAVLSRLERAFTSEHQTHLLISVLGLQAMYLLAEGDERRALAELQRALELAEPGGYIRVFADLGNSSRPLPTNLAKLGVKPAYIARILSALELQAERDSRRTIHAPSALPEWSLQGVTRREEDVLALLAKRYTDKEIAETLSVSHETIHTHIAHLGSKLGVHGRRAIVQKASELGFPA